MNYQVNHFIDGQIIAGSQQEWGDIYNPALGKIIGKVNFAHQADIEQAVLAAKTALPSWSRTPVIRRVRFMMEYLTLLRKNIDELAQIVTREHGKTLEDAKGSVLRGIEVVELACAAPQLLKGWFSENVATDVDNYTMLQPVGVCVGITPFNFPAMIPLWMFPLALVCGNTFILKPSEKDPSCAMKLAELFKQAGVPNGILNVINGNVTAVDALITHPDVAAVSFVGSTNVARHIYQVGTQHGKRVQAFGGAKNHCLVMPDADLESTADAIVGAAYGSAGERCMALSVVVAVGDMLADNLIAKMQSKITALQIGPGTEPQVVMGPLVTKQHLEKVQDYVALGVIEGAKLVIDGRNLKINGNEDGYFMGGCLFDAVEPTMRIYQEEIFGPVLCVVRVNSFEEGLSLINEHPYGNGTAIFTADGYAARQFASHVRVGMVGVNVPIPVPSPYHAFGGWKNSIFGDVNMHGSESIRFYTKLKTVTTRWPTSETALQASFTLPTH